MNDRDLLREYVESHSQDAFQALVGRHLPMVYSTARRILHESQLAEEVTQSVFTTLARKAGSIRPPQILGGWLYNTARHLAMNAVRAEQRRRQREQTAAAMQLLNSGPDEAQLAEHLEPAMSELSDEARDALVLRYLENRSLREVGVELGVSEDAARMRVNRALEQLRAGFERRGSPLVTTALLAAAMTSSTRAVPAGLAAAVAASATTALQLSTLATGSSAGVLARLLPRSAVKWLGGLAVTVVVGTWLLLRFGPSGNEGQVAADNGPAPAATDNQERAGNTAALSVVASPDAQGDPDPLSLLLTVAKARQRITSGTLQLQLSTDRLEGGRQQTNYRSLAVTFDEAKRRFEAVTRDYAYAASGADQSDQAKEQRRRADSMDREAAVQAGLLKAYEARELIASDGATLCRFQESEGTGGSTTIEDPAKGSANSSSYFFDPRCLGLRPSLSFFSTIEGCLGYQQAKSIRLLGKETVEGIPAWHIQVLPTYNQLLDFWVEVARPERLLKHASGDDHVISSYDDADPRNPVPVVVSSVESHQNRSLSFARRFVRTQTQFNVPVDPGVFTLAGLAMPVGTPVVDIRTLRDLGYWNGSGLSQFPPGKGARTEPAPNLSDLLTLLENYPSWPEALNAATWILLNTPDGPEVEKAAEVILREHTRDTNLVQLCKELERLRHRCSKPLLEAMLKDNINVEIRGTACMALARMRKDEAKFGQDRAATMEAEKLFQRVIRDFGQVTERGWKLEELAAPELSELRRLTVGKTAPEIEGEDLDGQVRRLGDYRGKVVVLTFWCHQYIEAPEHLQLVERFKEKPFAFVGVYGDDDPNKARAEVEKYGITWPSFRDKRHGPISKNWNVDSWPNIWVLDGNGVIRYRNVRGSDLVNAVEKLLQE